MEIGVNQGETFLGVNASRKVAVDPKFLFDVDYAKTREPHSEFHETTSDDYFASIDVGRERFSVVFIDGLHTFEQTLRDFTNAIHLIQDDGIIVIDDVIPSTYQASLPNQSDAFIIKAFTQSNDNSWMGDTFKLVYFIHSFFPTYELRTISDNHGQAVVWKAAYVRSGFHEYSILDLANLEFLDVVKRTAEYSKAPFADIVAELSTCRAR